jgi:hypothetical protein
MTIIEMIVMVVNCEECKNFFIKNKQLRGIDGSLPYFPQHKCRLGHKISRSKNGWIPLNRNFICKDFIKK